MATDLDLAVGDLTEAHHDAAYVLYMHAPLIVTLLRSSGADESAHAAAQEIEGAVARWRETSERVHRLVREEARAIIERNTGQR